MLAIPCSEKSESFSACRWAVRKRRRASSLAPFIFRRSPSARLRARGESVRGRGVGDIGVGLRHAKTNKIGRRYLLNDPMLDGVSGQLGVGGDAHFFHDVVAVVAEGIFADREPIGDLRFADTRGEEGEDLKFPIGESGVGLFVVGTVRGLGDP